LPLNPEVIRAAAREAVRGMIRSESVGDLDPLISSGRIDSLSILKLIGQLEAKLGIRLPVEQLQPDDFETVDLIVDTVERAAIQQ